MIEWEQFGVHVFDVDSEKTERQRENALGRENDRVVPAPESFKVFVLGPLALTD